MVKVCLHCFEIYKESLKFDEWADFQPCPKTSCIGEVVEIDDLLLPVIIELNKKGYTTKYCCAGHYYDHPINSYIMFDEDIELPSIPPNYKYENDHNTIRRNFSDIVNIENYKYFTEINNNATQLLKWAKSLSYYEN